MKENDLAGLLERLAPVLTEAEGGIRAMIASGDDSYPVPKSVSGLLEWHEGEIAKARSEGRREMAEMAKEAGGTVQADRIWTLEERWRHSPLSRREISEIMGRISSSFRVEIDAALERLEGSKNG